ncbi:phage tail tape measure protein [Metaclostridioides mangenotii]|uniref:phage tail tape measure protein n=1 Tax=Metaclostridioides mangenotii TaxID=1540 RepID=UPI00068D62B6|nr:phage tail tape measure protein [Clostridioides mangenotii]
MATDTQILQTILRLRDEVSANAKRAAAGIREVANASDSSSKEVQKLSENMKETSKTALKAGTALTVGFGGALALSAKNAISFESAFTGVKKTVDATDAELNKIKNGILDMSMRMPTAAEEIAAVGEAAGQLGIAVPNILGFTETMVMLGDTTNLSAEEASTALARFANITGMAQTNFDRLGSVIVALGNNFATTEAEITAMALRLAGAGSQVGLSEAQIMSFAGALSSVGIEAEAGGSAFSKVMIQMQLATETGKNGLKDFAKVAGMSSKEFQKAFKDDAGGAIISFIQGLGNAEKQGSSAIKVLDDMGIKEVRLRDALLRASGASDTFTNAIKLGNTAWSENTALVDEANTRYADTQSKIDIAKNAIRAASIVIGNNFLPVIKEVTETVAKVMSTFSKLPSGIQVAVTGVLVFGAILGTLMMVFGAAGLLITNFMTMVEPLGAFFASTLGTSVLVAFGAILALVSAFTYAYSTSEEFRNKIKDLGTSFMELIKPIASFFMPIFQLVGEKFKEVMATIAPFMSSIVNLASSILTALSPALVLIGALLTGGLLVAITIFLEMLKSAIATITNIFNDIATIVKGVIDVVVGIITGDGEKIKTGLGNIFKGTVKLVGDIWQGLIDFLYAPFQAAVDILDKKFGDKVKFVKDGWTGLKNFVKNPIKAVADLVTKNKEDKPKVPKFNMGEALQGAGDAVKAMSDSVVQEFEALKVKVGFKVQFMWTAIKGYFQAGINNIKAFVTETIPNIVDNRVNWFKELPFKIAYIAGQMVGSFIKFGVGVYTFATTQLPIIIESIVNWFRELPGKIKEFFSTVITNLTTWGTEFYTNAQTVVVNAVDAIVTFFSEMPGKVATFFATIIADVITWGLNLYISAAEAVMNMINTVVTWMSTLPGKVQTKLTEVINKVTAWGVNFVAKAKESAAKFKDAIIEGLSKIPGKVVSIGKDIVGGICRGIENAVKGLNGFFKKIADSFMNGIKDKLGIHSPSRVAAKLIGRHIPTGIAVGFIKALPEAMRTINKGAQRLVQGVDIPLGVSAPIDMNIGKANTYDPLQTNSNISRSNITGREKEIKGNKIEINIYGPVVREEEDINRITESVTSALVKKLRLSNEGGVI